MKKERYWLNQYNKLREMHILLKMLMNKNDCPFFWAEKRELEKDYKIMIRRISEALYDTEELTIKKSNEK